MTKEQIFAEILADAVAFQIIHRYSSPEPVCTLNELIIYTFSRIEK